LIINIEQVPTTYINLDQDTDKRLSMEQLLSKFTNVKRQPGILPSESITPDMVVAVAHKATIASQDSLPFLVLEDDCFEYQYRNMVDVPDDADILFLGVWSNAKKSAQLKDIFKVHHMIGAHAIMYITDNGRLFMDSVLDESIKTKVWHDKIFANMITEVNAYALNVPIFYQSSKKDYTFTEIESITNDTSKDLVL